MKPAIAGVSHPLEERISLYGELLVLARPLVPGRYEGEEVDCLADGVDDRAAEIHFVRRCLDVVMLNDGAPDLNSEKYCLIYD